MKTLMLKGGDLALSGRGLAMATGTTKVEQDLRGALAEPLGNDRFHPGWGSSLGDFVASLASEDTRLGVEAEVNRVISNYASVQRDKVEADIYGDAETRFSTDEIVSAVREVSSTVTRDRIDVKISLQTASGEVVSLSEGVMP